jgi:hypothetical protein
MVSIPDGSSVADLVNVAQEVFKTPETLVAVCWGRALPYTNSVDGLSEAECVHLVSLGK